MKLFIILGALNAMMAVGTGAFGAHGLQGKISDPYLSVWEKATTYQMYHGLALLIIGVISGTTSINVNLGINSITALGRQTVAIMHNPEIR
ncbi:DUF423 domain-containing protein, partial [Staphylococcus aureus]|uniref:DUF423 domain-containing protein n=1 Tax=Staphylococcus aureus TaxID=1280 RepID=UPI00210A9DCC